MHFSDSEKHKSKLLPSRIMACPRCQVTAVHTFLVIAPEIASEMPSEIMNLSGQHIETSAAFLLGLLQVGSDTVWTVLGQRWH